MLQTPWMTAPPAHARRWPMSMTLMTVSDDLGDLLARVATGDRTAFRRLYDQAGGRVFAIALGILRRADAAEDVAQETFLRIWQRAGQYDPARGAALAWIGTIARNLALDRVSRQGPGDLPLPEPDEPGEPQVPADHGADDRRDLARCLETLSPDHRRAVLLAVHHGFTHDELARHLGVPLGTAKAWVRRGLLRLKGCLDQ